MSSSTDRPRVLSSLLGSLFLTAAALLASGSGAYAQSLALATVNNSVCYFSDDDNVLANATPYNPASANCNETGISDLNVFQVASSTTGGGSTTVILSLKAGLVVDANPGSTEYQAGKIAYALTLSIAGTGGAAWDLTIDQAMQGLVVTYDDGAGVANAGISGVTAALNLGPSLSFGSTTTRSSAATGSEPFAFSRSGDVIQGVGDTVLTGTVEIDLDAYSACGGLFCLGWADEGAVLFGIDDVSQSSFVSSDEYATWGRAVAPDGYEAQFSLTLTGGFCGDGTTDPPEECDDGNISNNDGCSSNCLNEFCGDGIRQSGIGEECDDGNTTNGDGCSAICEVEGVPVPALSSRGEQFLVLALIGVAALVVGFRRRRPA